MNTNKKYEIHHAKVEAPNGSSVIGIEVQPPLSEASADGVTQALTRKEPGNDYRFAANDAYVTRSDTAGTAFMVIPNLSRQLSSGDVAQIIGALIDPCGIHEVTYSPPVGE